MTDLLFLVCALLAWGALAYKLLAFRKAPHNFALRALLVSLGAIAMAFTIGMPSVLAAADRLIGVPNVARLVSHTCIVVFSAAVQRFLLYWAHDPETARKAGRSRTWVFVVALTLMTTLFLLAAIDEETSDFTRRYATEPLVVAYLLVYVSSFGLALAGIVRLSWRYTTLVTQRFYKLGLRLTGIGAGFGLGYCVYKGIFVLGHSLGLSLPPALSVVGEEEAITPVLASVGALLVTVGLTIPAWGPWLTTLGTWGRRYRAYGQLRSLWFAIYRAFPQVVFDPPRSMIRDRFTLSDLEFRLIRRVVEIRDGCLELRPYVVPQATSIAMARGREAGLSGRELEVVVYAANLAAALHAKQQGQQTAGAGVDSFGGSDLSSEVEWLTQVGRAFACSPVVTAVRNELDTTHPTTQPHHSHSAK